VTSLNDRCACGAPGLALRDGAENMHADGAFEDSDAPALNRALRNALYEALREGVDKERAGVTEWSSRTCARLVTGRVHLQGWSG
jgi:hypothetical protein